MEHDDEGRVVTAEFSDFFVVNAYVPNSGDGLKRLDYRINKWDRGELKNKIAAQEECGLHGRKVWHEQVHFSIMIGTIL